MCPLSPQLAPCGFLDHRTQPESHWTHPSAASASSPKIPSVGVPGCPVGSPPTPAQGPTRPWGYLEREEPLSQAFQPSSHVGCQINTSEWPRSLPHRAEKSPRWTLPDQLTGPWDLKIDYCCVRSLMLRTVLLSNHYLGQSVAFFF